MKIVKILFVLFGLLGKFVCGSDAADYKERLFSSARHDNDWWVSRAGGYLGLKSKLEPCKPYINSLDEHGEVALNYAIIQRCEMVAKWLIANGANVNIVGRTSGLAPLHAATIYSQPNIVWLLLRKGACPHAKDSDGFTVLDLVGLAEPNDDTVAIKSLLSRVK